MATPIAIATAADVTPEGGAAKTRDVSQETSEKDTAAKITKMRVAKKCVFLGQQRQGGTPRVNLRRVAYPAKNGAEKTDPPERTGQHFSGSGEQEWGWGDGGPVATEEYQATSQWKNNEYWNTQWKAGQTGPSPHPQQRDSNPKMLPEDTEADKTCGTCWSDNPSKSRTTVEWD